MTDYDEVSARLATDEAVLDMMARGDAEMDHRYGHSTHPLDELDSESLASFNLRRIRKELGLSQQQIADRIAADRPGGAKLSQTQIAKIERGERPWRVNEMAMIANALGIHWDEFFTVRPGEDYGRLETEAARLRYERAKALAEAARAAWREAARAEFEAEEEFVHTAAKNRIKHPQAMWVLEMRWHHQDYIKDILEETPITPEPLEGRRSEAREYAEQQWKRVSLEVQKVAPEAENTEE